MKGYCEHCKKKETCKKGMGIFFGFCQTDFVPATVKKINWKIMETHARNYDGSCRFCGGKCTDEAAVKMREYVGELFDDIDAYNDGSTDKKPRYSYSYLKRHYEKTTTYIIRG